MKFCSDCGGAIEQRVPEGDDRARPVCTRCQRVHYQNPLVVVGCIVERGSEVLLCRRAIEPVLGRWTIPAGYLELGETLIAGACRETLEEAGADVAVTAPHSYLDLPHAGQTHATFRAELRRPGIHAGAESLEVAFFASDALPWDELAFPAVRIALELWCDDQRQARRSVHHGRLLWSGEGSRFEMRHYRLAEHLRSPLA